MCTAVRFTNENGGLFFGRNLDWMESYGEKILATPRGFAYDYALGATHSEQPYAVVGVGCIMDSKPMYFDCANETGLAVAGLNFPRCGAFPHESVEGKCSVATFEFPLWVARNFASTDEVEHALADTQIVSLVQPGQPESLLHWLIADSTRSIVVESTKAGLHVYENRADVLANSPELPWHIANLDNYLHTSNESPRPSSWGAQELRAWGIGAGMQGIPGDPSSPSRFVRAAYANAHHPAKTTERENVARLFRTLASVQITEGTAKSAEGHFEKTIFTSGFSSSTNTYYANTYDDFEIRAFPFESFDLDGRELQTRALYRGEEEVR